MQAMMEVGLHAVHKPENIMLSQNAVPRPAYFKLISSSTRSKL
jgi:hypothetical protein